MRLSMQIHPADDVAVALVALDVGIKAENITLKERIPFGHKFALRAIAAGEEVKKYGYAIGKAKQAIQAGEWVHTHNLFTALGEKPTAATADIPIQNLAPQNETCSPAPDFMGYENTDGTVGIRNEIWILPTVGCVNKTAERLAQEANRRFGHLCDGFYAYTHPYGCSQMGEDHTHTQTILASLAHHPNAAGTLLVSLGCENNNLDSFLPLLGVYDRQRIQTIVTQDCADELQEGLACLEQLALRASKRKRVKISASRLVIGYKCGGSDAFSGITANPLCGRLTDLLTACGARAILTEVPEMFGAEQILMTRACNAEIRKKIDSMVQDFKEYYEKNGQVVYENPSPGNKQGGITTLEEKSLGCIQKGGTATVTDVLSYTEACKAPGLNLLTGPGNDIVSCTNLTAAGAHLIVFTTGRGTPLGAPVPTLKVSANSPLAQKKPGWIDYDAGQILVKKSMHEAANELLQLMLATASGEIQTKNEQNGYREIAIFKNGVTL